MPDPNQQMTVNMPSNPEQIVKVAWYDYFASAAVNTAVLTEALHQSQQQIKSVGEELAKAQALIVELEKPKFRANEAGADPRTPDGAPGPQG